jgi:hypothetical protein
VFVPSLRAITSVACRAREVPTHRLLVAAA